MTRNQLDSEIAKYTWQRTPYAGGYYVVLNADNPNIDLLKRELDRSRIIHDVSEEKTDAGSSIIISISEYNVPAALKSVFASTQAAASRI